MANINKQSAKLTAEMSYRPLFLDRSGDLRPSVERELNSISQAIWSDALKFKNFPKDQLGFYVYPTGGGSGGTAGVASFKGRTGAVVPTAGDYSADMISGALTINAADARYELKGTAGPAIDLAPYMKTVDADAKYDTKVNAVAALALKADKATTYTKTEVDTAIAAHSGGGTSISTTEVIDLNYIGETKWHNSNVPVPEYAIHQDGQLLKRSDYPELWAKIEDGSIKAIADTEWVNTVTARANFSKGTIDTGADANFRVPDLNGVQQNSIKGLFVRGSERGDTNAGGLGVIRENAAPNITGSMTFHAGENVDGSIMNGVSGAFVKDLIHSNKYRSPGNITSATGADSFGSLKIDASHSSAAYGRNSSTEVHPNQVSGIWILIAKKPGLQVKVIDSFIGQVSWWNGSKTKLPENNIPANGQIVNRADEPELWSLIEDGTLFSVSDDLWLNAAPNDPLNNASNRGCYSTGDGTTTFRMPDLNGAQTGSWGHLYLTALSPSSTHTPGTILPSSAPDIQGQFTVTVDGKFHIPMGSYANAFSALSTADTNIFNGYTGPLNPLIAHTRGAKFAASASNGIYGRFGNTTEITPNSAYGMWIIKSKSETITLQQGESLGSKGDVTAAGNNTFTGKNTFTSNALDGSLEISVPNISFKANADGVKPAVTFADTSAVLVPEPTGPTSAVTKKYVDDAIDAAGSGGTTPDLSKYLDKTLTTAQTVKGPVTFQDSLLVAAGHTVGFTQATHVQVPNNASLPNDAISKEYLETHVYDKTDVDTKIAGISSGGGVTVPETLTNMDGVHTTGWYFTDYHTTPSMSQIPNNYGDYAIVNHVTQSGTNGFAYQVMFTGGAAFGDAASQKTIWFRVNQDNSASAWSTIKWNKIGDTSALESSVAQAIDYNKWYLGDDPKVLEYIDWLDAGTVAGELKRINIKFGPNSMHVRGLIYKTMPVNSDKPKIFTVKKALPGFTKVRKSYTPYTLDGNPGIRFTTYSANQSIPFTVQSDQSVGGTQAGWLMFDELITFE